jgi:glycosyltransferase involved in cell wall biosynthesis
MDVIVAHPSLNRGGGAEKVCLTTVRTLVKKGYRVTLATVDKTDWPFLRERFGEISSPNKEFYLLEKMTVKGKFSQAALTLSCYLPELFFLKMKAEHEVLVNTYGDLVDSIADISYINAVPLRVAHHYPESGFSSSAVWRTITQGYGFSLSVADRIFVNNILLANSRFTQHVMKKHLRRHSKVVYPPVDTEKFRLLAAKKAKRENLVAVVSRLRLGKQLELVPKIARLARKGRFVILGLADEASQDAIDSLTRTIKSLGVEDRVELLVNRSFRELAGVLASAKVFLSSQRFEAFGMAVVESMASGCVPVVPRDGGPWFDILDQNQGKYGYSYRTIEEAAKEVQMLLTNEELRAGISSKACVRAMDFDISVFEDEISCIVELVSSGKASQSLSK